ncbi:MAG: hypothetical protein ACOC6G_04195 [Thermoproteota archaeon]
MTNIDLLSVFADLQLLVLEDHTLIGGGRTLPGFNRKMNGHIPLF